MPKAVLLAGTNNGYWPSSATTAFTLMAASATVTPAPSAADQYFITAIAGLFVFVAIIAVVMLQQLISRLKCA